MDANHRTVGFAARLNLSNTLRRNVGWSPYVTAGRAQMRTVRGVVPKQFVFFRVDVLETARGAEKDHADRRE